MIVTYSVGVTHATYETCATHATCATCATCTTYCETCHQCNWWNLCNSCNLWSMCNRCNWWNLCNSLNMCNLWKVQSVQVVKPVATHCATCSNCTTRSWPTLHSGHEDSFLGLGLFTVTLESSRVLSICYSSNSQLVSFLTPLGSVENKTNSQ